MTQPITIETTIHAPLEKVWRSWTEPECIVHWAFASDDWHVPAAENDVRVGGSFKTVMAAKDGSAQFDFAGKYTQVKENEVIEYDLGTERHVKVEFTVVGSGVTVVQTFDPESENSREKQQAGWQAILDNFKRYVENSA